MWNGSWTNCCWAWPRAEPAVTTPDAAPAALAQRQARRLAAQLLSGPPAAGPAEVAGHLLAIQAQDPRGARLAVRARSRARSAAEIDAALTQDRSVVVTWLNRGTLHLVRAEDYWWLGPLTRAQLAERIAAAGVRTEGQAIVHLLALASLRGRVLRGPMAGREHAYALVRDWLGAPPAQHVRFDRDRALTELAARYLAGHGPASDRDLAKWAGLPLRDARRGLAAIAGRLADRADGLAELAGRHRDCPLPAPRLLGAYDPLLLGWDSREPVVGEHGKRIAVNGLFRPFALVRGRAVGTWGLPGGKVALAPFAPLDDADAAALAADAADVERFLRPG